MSRSQSLHEDGLAEAVADPTANGEDVAPAAEDVEAPQDAPTEEEAQQPDEAIVDGTEDDAAAAAADEPAPVEDVAAAEEEEAVPAAETEAAEAQPEEAEAQPEEVEAQPEEAEAQPEEGDEQPEEAEAQPEEPEAQPEEVEAQPEEGEAQPEEGEAQPEEHEAQPEVVEAQPEEPEAQPEEHEAQPEEVEAQPEELEAQPEEVEAQPEEGEALPEEHEAQPEEPEAQPEEVEAQPEEVEAQPEEPEAQPEEHEAQPEEVEAQPEELEAQPEEVEAQPEEGEAQPEEHEAQPEEVEAQPEEPEAQPEEHEAQPEEVEAQPEELEAQPEEVEAQPEEGEAQPEEHEAQPEVVPAPADVAAPTAEEDDVQPEPVAAEEVAPADEIELQDRDAPDDAEAAPVAADDAVDAEVARAFAGGAEDDMADMDDAVGAEVAEPADADEAWEGEQPDNVASDVRAPPAEPLTYQELPVSGDAGAAAPSPPSRNGSVDAGTDAPQGSSYADEKEDASAYAPAVVNPSQGIQADNEAIDEAAHQQQQQQQEHDEAEEAEEAEMEAAADGQETHHRHHQKQQQQQQQSSPSGGAVEYEEENVDQEHPQLVQAALGSAMVHATLEPMCSHTTLTLPVSRSVRRPKHASVGATMTNIKGVQSAHRDRSRRSSNASAFSTDSGPGASEGCWLLSARGLYEALSTRLCVHPQTMRVYRSGTLVRFSDTIMLDVDYTTAQPAPGGDANVLLGSDSEPLWISIRFIHPRNADATGTDASATAEEEEGAAGASTGDADADPADAVPEHLAVLNRGEVLERCLVVRRTKPQLTPHMLMDGRRQGLSFREMVERSYAFHRGIAGDEENTTIMTIVRAEDFVRKPYIGGYRAKEDPSRIFLHATTQLFVPDLRIYSTHRQKRPPHPIPGFDTCTRQTQTYGTSRSCQTARECCVQTPSFMDTGRIVMDDSHDYVVVARPYFTAAALHELRVKKAVVLQCLYRQWKARQTRLALELEDELKQRRAEQRQREEEAAQQAKQCREELRRTDPRTAADFERLKEEVVQWRIGEVQQIMRDTSLTEKGRRAALVAISREELKMLQELDLRRQYTLRERRDNQFAAHLDRTAADKVWGPSSVHVTTPETVRAGELRDLYDGLANHSPQQPREERLDVLLQVKWTIMEFLKTATGRHAPVTASSARPASRTRVKVSVGTSRTATLSSSTASTVCAELAQLIDREADLLHRGRREASLTGLRKRIETLFRQFIEDPLYNPGVAPFTTTALGRAKVHALGLDSNKSRETIRAAAETALANSSSPYGGYAAANCASCSQQLRVATLKAERRQRQTEMQQHAEEPEQDETQVEPAEDRASSQHGHHHHHHHDQSQNGVAASTR